MNAALATAQYVDYAAAGLGAFLTALVTYRVIRPCTVLGPPLIIAIITGLLAFLALYKHGGIVLIAYLCLVFAIPVVLTIAIARRYGLMGRRTTGWTAVATRIARTSVEHAASVAPQARSTSEPAPAPVTETPGCKKLPSSSSGAVIPMTPFKTKPEQLKSLSRNLRKDFQR